MGCICRIWAVLFGGKKASVIFTVLIQTAMSSWLHLELWTNAKTCPYVNAQKRLHKHVWEKLAEIVTVVFSPSCNATQPATINLLSRNVESQRIPIKSSSVCVPACVQDLCVVCSRKCYSYPSVIQPIQTCRPNSLPPPSNSQCGQYEVLLRQQHHNKTRLNAISLTHRRSIGTISALLRRYRQVRGGVLNGALSV